MGIINEATSKRIRERLPFTDDPWLIGYRSKGGTYIIASNGKQTDSGKPRDLIALTPFGIHQLWFSVSPELASEVEALV